MLSNILTAIFTKFNGSALSTALGGRMYSRYAPQNTAFPYATVDISTIAADWTFSESIEDADVLFNIYSQSASEVEITGLLANLIALYDDCALSVTGYSHLYMQRDIIRSLANPDYGIRQCSIIYNLEIIK